MALGTIVVADDDAAIRTVLNQALSRAGYEVRLTSNAATLWRWVSRGDGDLVITDVVMPDENAFDLLPRIKRARPDLPIIVMSAQNTFMTAIRASERGAYDYLPKPFDLKELIAIVGRALSGPKTRRLEPEPDVNDNIPLVGRSPAMQEIYRVLARLMQTDLTVMIAGESGTGKELVARALHDYGKRRERPVRRHQHGRHPARPHRGGAFRPREGRLHRRRGAKRRPLRAGRRRHAVPRRDRRHADGGADAAPARAAAGRIHHRRRPDADQGRRAHHRRDQQGPPHPDQPGLVPRGSVLSAERRADPAAGACANAPRISPTSCAISSPGGEGGAAGQADRDRCDRTAAAAIAGPAMCANWRT